MTHQFRTFLGFTIVMAVAAAASAQSLGDVARKEQARRTTVKAPAKVYTNDTLDSDGQPAGGSQGNVAQVPPSQSGAQESQAAKKDGEKTDGQKTDNDSTAADPKKDQAYWRTRMSEAREGLARAETFQEALQSRINALSTDFVNRDDPAQRQVVARDRQKALAEMDRVKQEIQQFKKSINDIQEEARRAGVPAGWVR
jgi:chromosome segregation ATPase